MSAMVRWEDGNLPWKDKKRKRRQLKTSQELWKNSHTKIYSQKSGTGNQEKIQNRITENFIIYYSPENSSCLGQCSLDQFQLPPSNQNDQRKPYVQYPTYLGMYVCMYSIYVCIYICVYVCMYVCIHIHTYIGTQGQRNKGETQTRPCINKTLKRTGVWLWRTEDIQKQS